MKCYYCEEECEGLSFQQSNIIVIAHKECAQNKVSKDESLLKEGVEK